MTQIKTESYREHILYLRQDEPAKVQLSSNEEVVDVRLAQIGGEIRWTFIIKKTSH